MLGVARTIASARRATRETLARSGCEKARFAPELPSMNGMQRQQCIMKGAVRLFDKSRDQGRRALRSSHARMMSASC